MGYSEVKEDILEDMTTGCGGINCRNWEREERVVGLCWIECGTVSDVVPGIRPLLYSFGSKSNNTLRSLHLSSRRVSWTLYDDRKPIARLLLKQIYFCCCR